MNAQQLLDAATAQLNYWAERLNHAKADDMRFHQEIYEGWFQTVATLSLTIALTQLVNLEVKK